MLSDHCNDSVIGQILKPQFCAQNFSDPQDRSSPLIDAFKVVFLAQEMADLSYHVPARQSALSFAKLSP